MVVPALSPLGCGVSAKTAYPRACAVPHLIMKSTYKTVYYADGWLEIREAENPDGWIATSSPSEIDP